MTALLEVTDLSVAFTRRGKKDVKAVDGVTFAVEAGQTVGLVGESGCGKSVTSLAVMGLLPKRNVRVEGSVRFDGDELLTMREADLRDKRGRDLAMVFQDPLSALNPVVPLGVQVAEVLQRHRGMNRAASAKRGAELLEKVGIPDPTRRLKEYPHQLSGGMRQRVLIAMALACEPRLLVADEPTTALDVTIQAQILSLLRELVTDAGTALLLITHDLGVVAGVCDEVTVLYSGRVVERALRHPLFAAPAHPYTNGLLASLPRLDAPRGQRLTPIPGSVADGPGWATGCAFAPRCPRVTDECRTAVPTLDVATEAFRPPVSGRVTVYDSDRTVRCFHPVSA